MYFRGMAMDHHPPVEPFLYATRVEPDALPQYHLALEQYHAMIDAGIIGEDEHVELLNGLLTRSMSVNPPHAAALRRTARWLRAALAGQALEVFEEDPITLPPDSEPEPDIAVVDARADDYAGQHPGPDDIHLLVEVADDSLRRDRLVKLPLYAGAGIREYWIVNLRERQLEVYTDPLPARPAVERAPSYADIVVYASGDRLRHPLYGEVEVEALLPPEAMV